MPFPSPGKVNVSCRCSSRQHCEARTPARAPRGRRQHGHAWGGPDKATAGQAWRVRQDLTRRRLGDQRRLGDHRESVWNPLAFLSIGMMRLIWQRRYEEKLQGKKARLGDQCISQRSLELSSQSRHSWTPVYELRKRLPPPGDVPWRCAGHAKHRAWKGQQR